MNGRYCSALVLALLVPVAALAADNRAAELGRAIGKLVRLEAEYHRAGREYPAKLVKADTLYAEMLNSYDSSPAADYADGGEGQPLTEIVSLLSGLPEPPPDDPAGRIVAALRASPQTPDSVRPLLDGYGAMFQLVLEMRRYLRMPLGTAEALGLAGIPLTLKDIGLSRADSSTAKAIAEQAGAGSASERGSEAYLFYSAMLDIDDLGGRFAHLQSEAGLADRVMGGAAYAELAEKLKALPAQTVVFFGDSQTDNRHWSSPAHFPKIVEEVFRRINPKVQIFNAGVGGDDSGEGLERLRADVLDRKPDICFILFGGNDASFWGDPEPAVPPEKFIVNIDSMVTALQATGCRPVIVSHPINPEWPDYMGPPAAVLIERMNADELALSRRRGTGWLDLCAEFATHDNKRMHSIDNDHFSPEAHGLIAELVLRKLVEMN
jgi:lysophospholipase L1-like esterase